jgi:hypothetical protein
MLSTALTSINDNNLILLLIILPSLPLYFSLIRVNLLDSILLLVHLVLLSISTLAFGVYHFLNLTDNGSLFLTVSVGSETDLLGLEGLSDYFLLLKALSIVVHLFYALVTIRIPGWRCGLLRRMERNLRRDNHFTLLIFQLLFNDSHLLAGVGVASRMGSGFTFNLKTRDGLFYLISLVLSLIRS